MTDHDTPDAGLLTDSERDVLTDPDSDASRAKLIDEFSDRIGASFKDIELLYMCLTDDEFRSVFGNDTDTRKHMRYRAHHVFTFLYYGLQLTGDDVTHRITSAIEAAEAASNRDATATLDIITQPFLPLDQQIDAIQNGAIDQVSLQALDRLWYDDTVPPDDVVDAYAALGEPGLTVEDVQTAREDTQSVERMPAPVITSIEPHTGPAPEDDT